MQDNKQGNQPLDDDILQCKADIHEAINATGGSAADNLAGEQSSEKDRSVPAVEPIDKEDVFLEMELDDADLGPDSDQNHKPPEPIPVQISPFNTIQKNNHTPQSNESDILKSQLEQEKTVRHTLRKSIQVLEKELQEKTHLLTQQKQRFEFLEKQLKNAIVLERAKFQLQQNVENLNSKNQKLVEEKQQLAQDKHRLSAEIAELKSQLKNLDITGHVQQLQKDLKNTQSALTHEKARSHEHESTIQTLGNNLTASHHDGQTLSDELSATKEELKQVTLKYDQLQDEHGRLHAQKDTELADMATKLKDSERDLSQLETDLKQARHQYEALKTQTSKETQTLTEKTDFLENENNSLSAEIIQLKTQLEDLRANDAQAQQLRKELESIELTLSHEHALVRDLKRTIKTLEDDLAAVTQEKQDLSEKLGASEMKQEQLKSKYDRLQDEFDRFHAQEDSELANMTTKLEDSKRDLSQLETNFKQARHQYEALKSKASKKIQALTEKTDFFQNENSSLSAEIIQLKTQLEDLRANDDQAQQLRKELESIELTLSHEQASVHDLKDTVKTLEDDLAAVAQEKHDLSEKLGTSEMEQEQLKSKYDLLQDEYDRFHAQEDNELANIRLCLKDSKNDLEKLHADFEQTRHEYEAFQTQANGEIQVLTENKDLLKKENKSFLEQISRLKKEQLQAKKVAEELHAIEFNLKNTQKDLLVERNLSQKHQQEQEHVKISLSEMQQEKEELLSRQEELQSIESQLRDEIINLQESVKSNDSTRNELAAAQEEIKQLYDKNQNLQNRLNKIQKANIVPSDENTQAPEERLLESIGSQSEKSNNIPVFNLADQIMEEHRRSIANRRQRVQPMSSLPQNNTIKKVVQQYVHSSTSDTVVDNKKTGVDHHPWIDHSLTSFQQEILQEIVRKDMRLYSHKHSLMNN